MSPRTRLLLASVTVAFAGAAAALLLLTVLHAGLDGPLLTHLDRSLQAHVHALASPGITGIMLSLTWIGAIKIFASALGLVLGYLWLTNRRHSAALLGGAMAGAFALNESLKLHFHRGRPQLPWSIGDEHTFSFPSGHSLFSVVLYGTLAYLALRQGSSKPAVLPLACVLPPAVGISRIYLGMHYPSDVLAGFTAGAVWLATVITIDRLWLRMTSHLPLITGKAPPP